MDECRTEQEDRGPACPGCGSPLEGESSPGFEAKSGVRMDDGQLVKYLHDIRCASCGVPIPDGLVPEAIGGATASWAPDEI